MMDTTTTTTTATTSYLNTGSPAKRRALHPISSDGNAPSQNNDTIEMPFLRVSSSRSHCFVCGTYYSKTYSSYCSINEIMRAETLLTHGIVIRNGSTCCEKHLDKNQFKTDAIASIKKKIPNTSTISRDELLHSHNDLNVAYRRLQSMLDEANRRSAIDFDDLYRLTDEPYFILTGITKNNFLDLCSSIPSTSLRQSESRSANQAVSCLLVKLRLGLSHEVLATLFSLPDKKTFSRILESARKALMAHFVPKHLGFEHISRQDVIANHTRPLAKRLFTNPGDDAAILILDGTYIYVQKSANNIVQR
ncbi:unnamed protein product [Rotaria sp. Silwood1]|nr:unnamed protein product [Rotaria sp. Silwood1]